MLFSPYPAKNNTTRLLALTHADPVVLHGTCQLAVLQGKIHILGALIQPSPQFHQIFAPTSAPLPVLRPAAALADPPRPALPLPSHITNPAQYDAIILIDDLPTPLDRLGDICKPFQGIFTTPPAGTPLFSSTTYTLLPLDENNPISTFELPPSWSTALSPSTLVPSRTTTSPPVFLTKGPKKCGKSTFSRTLLNRLLNHYTRVAYLETDLGQTELTPPGLVSLHVLREPLLGPAFTHPRTPYRAHFVGASTPRNEPGFYLDAVQDLVHTYTTHVQIHPWDDGIDSHSDELEGEDERISDVIPLVVNTMGWSKGLGADLTHRIIDFIQPTHIFEIQPPSLFEDQQPTVTTRSNYSAFQSQSHSGIPLNPTSTTNIHTLLPPTCLFASSQSQSQSPSQSPSYTPADYRALSFLSYFYSIPSTSENSSWNTTTLPQSLPLLAHPPYNITLSTAFDSIILTGPGSEDVIPEEMERVLNGALVAFVEVDGGDGDDELQVAEQTEADATQRGRVVKKPLYTQTKPPPHPSHSRCLGLGFIRGVSSVNTTGRLPHPPLSTDVNMDTGMGMEIDARETEKEIEQVEEGTKIHLLTPLQPQTLLHARTLVKGELEMPIWAFLDHRAATNNSSPYGLGAGPGAGVGETPYLQWGSFGTSNAHGGDKKRVRRNLMRRGHV